MLEGIKKDQVQQDKLLKRTMKELETVKEQLKPHLATLSRMKAASGGVRATSKWAGPVTPHMAPMDYSGCSDVLLLDERVLELQLLVRHPRPTLCADRPADTSCMCRSAT